ncbi:biotin-dependent carboxyltransferase family protein [Bacillaceae bacterium SIJ1]|uniref:5-oxoprolinase subunit C family protein n=1 Tax=Litoribacterium kuwaitense TaxID=1398745 RepID=UPI0013EAF8F1|nr:biotin-dependent carboxyltransferase family protein [Litoribacterium kuwaitense]NGP44687.1 biotin-dependent carboxyltransferase family protein [Litoribacterium kuwaitense]
MNTINMFYVHQSGLQTTLQDAGRYGYQSIGLGPGGAMDPFAFKVANLLVGNEPNTLAIEVALAGPTLECLHETIIAITGANLSPTVNGKPAPMWQALQLEKGDVVKFGKPISGARAYIAVNGGLHVNTILGSGAFHSKADIGTLIRTHDTLTGKVGQRHFLWRKALSLSARPKYDQHVVLRVLSGPDEARFTKKSTEAFYHSAFTVKQGDRMGLFLDGVRLFANGDHLLSGGVTWGSVQVPHSGNPILLLQDRQTTGGYPRIATVASMEQSKVAQLLPGHTVEFKKINVREAQRHLRSQHRTMNMLAIRALGHPIT